MCKLQSPRITWSRNSPGKNQNDKFCSPPHKRAVECLTSFCGNTNGLATWRHRHMEGVWEFMPIEWLFNELMSRLLLDIDCMHGTSQGVWGVTVKSHHAAAMPMGYPAFRLQLFSCPPPQVPHFKMTVMYVFQFLNEVLETAEKSRTVVEQCRQRQRILLKCVWWKGILLKKEFEFQMVRGGF